MGGASNRSLVLQRGESEDVVPPPATTPATPDLPLPAHRTMPEFVGGADTDARVKVMFGSCQLVGKKHAMQDCVSVTTIKLWPDAREGGKGEISVFGVYDGHGPTDACVRFVASGLPACLERQVARLSATAVPEWAAVLYDAFVECGDEWIACAENPRSGCVAAVALVAGLDVVLANVGDCRAVVTHPRLGCVQVTRDHRANDPDEARRVVEEGGFVRNGRVLNVLAPSRAFGDTDLRQSADGSLNEVVTHRPDTYFVNVTLDHVGQAVMILASDGVWDEMGVREAMDIVRAELERAPGDLNNAARALAERAEQLNDDDISVQIVTWDRLLR